MQLHKTILCTRDVTELLLRLRKVGTSNFEMEILSEELRHSHLYWQLFMRLFDIVISKGGNFCKILPAKDLLLPASKMQQ